MGEQKSLGRTLGPRQRLPIADIATATKESGRRPEAASKIRVLSATISKGKLVPKLTELDLFRNSDTVGCPKKKGHCAALEIRSHSLLKSLISAKADDSET